MMAASEPTSLLSLVINTFQPFTLNQYFGTLTVVRVVPLSGHKLTPVPPFPKVYGVKTFGVGQESENFRPLTFKSVALPP